MTITTRPEPATAESPAMVRLEVRDTGAGIPPEDRERIFDKFYQVGRMDGDRPSGTGLGLTIARHLVELHAGRIWVESEKGAGSRFVVLLPVAGGESDPRAAAPAAVATAVGAMDGAGLASEPTP